LGNPLRVNPRGEKNHRREKKRETRKRDLIPAEGREERRDLERGRANDQDSLWIFGGKFRSKNRVPGIGEKSAAARGPETILKKIVRRFWVRHDLRIVALEKRKYQHTLF